MGLFSSSKATNTQTTNYDDSSVNVGAEGAIGAGGDVTIVNNDVTASIANAAITAGLYGLSAGSAVATNALASQTSVSNAALLSNAALAGKALEENTLFGSISTQAVRDVANQSIGAQSNLANISVLAQNDLTNAALKSYGAIAGKALDSTGAALTSATDIAKSALTSAELFGKRAADMQTETINATSATTRQVLGFAEEASKTADERITTTVVKYAIYAAVGLAALFLLPLLFRKKTA